MASKTTTAVLASFIIGFGAAILAHPVWHEAISGPAIRDINETSASQAPEIVGDLSEHPVSISDSRAPVANSAPVAEKPMEETVVDSPLVEIPKTPLVDQMGREMPANYIAMVTPRPLPERLTTQEMYRDFLNDPRDEAWAYPMEVGINQFIEDRGGKYSATFEYVQCTSRYCTIAGVVYGGGQPTVNEVMAEMTQRGWWQTFGGNNTVGSSTNNEYRFVSIFPRTPEDFSRKESAGQSTVKANQSSVKSIGG